MLLQQNRSGQSVLTVAALPSKEVPSSPLVGFKRPLDQLRATWDRFKKPNIERDIEHFQDVFGSIKRYLVETTQGEDKMKHLVQIIEELSRLQSDGWLKPSYCCKLIQCLMEISAPGEIGTPTLVSATSDDAYYAVKVALAHNAETAKVAAVVAPNETNNDIQNQILSQPSKTTPGTFQQQILEKSNALKARRGNASGLSSEKDQQPHRNQQHRISQKNPRMYEDTARSSVWEPC